MKHSSYNHYVIMFFIMILAGLLSTMNVWVDKAEHIRLSLNDIYMIFLMTGWMFLFMGIFYKELIITSIGLLLVIVNLFFIRTQFMISEDQYKRGMIPHHSMAIHMSKKLLNKNNNLEDFLKNLINTQENEIVILNQYI
jgi:hypothetical protein